MRLGKVHRDYLRRNMQTPTKAETKALEKKDLEIGISNRMADAYMKAFDSLGRYKFLMFGYWAAQWVNLNSLLPTPRPNPFRALVKFAKGRPDLEENNNIGFSIDNFADLED